MLQLLKDAALEYLTNAINVYKKEKSSQWKQNLINVCKKRKKELKMKAECNKCVQQRKKNWKWKHYNMKAKSSSKK